MLVLVGGHDTPQALHALGYWPLGLVEAARALLLTALLFAGPLFETLVVEGGWREWLSLAPVKEVLGEWTAWRNIVAVSVKSPFLPSGPHRHLRRRPSHRQ